MPTLTLKGAPALLCLSLAAAPALAQGASDGEWTMPAKDYASTRYSRLDQITARNATRLRPVWTFSTGVLAGHQGQPLVVKNTMYVVIRTPLTPASLAGALRACTRAYDVHQHGIDAVSADLGTDDHFLPGEHRPGGRHCAHQVAAFDGGRGDGQCGLGV